MPYNFKTVTPDATGVSAGGRAIVDIPVTQNHTYMQTFLRVTKVDGTLLTQAELLAQLGDITVKINGGKKWEADMELLAYLANKVNGNHETTVPDGYIHLPWQRMDLVTADARELTGFGMLDVSKFTIELDIKAGSTISRIEPHHLVAPVTRNFGTHITIEKHSEDVTSTGKKIYSDLPIQRDMNEHLLQLIYRENGGEIEKTAMKVGNVWVKEESYVDLDKYQLEVSGQVEQNGYCSIEFDRSRTPLGLLPLKGIRTFRQDIYWKTKPTNERVDIFLIKIQDLVIK